MKKTKNYAMPYPEQDDYFNVEDFQDMMVSVDNLMKKISDSGAQISSDAEHLYNQTKAQMDNIQKRMNTFTSLKDGSTTGDAELKDIRVAYDGKEYGNAGEAVREQASDIHKALFGAGASIWSKAKSESTKYVAETKGICILNERFTAAGVVAKISRGTFAQNESTLNLDRECSAYIVEFEKNPGTVYMPSAETIKIVSTTKIIFEANGNARCWIPVKKGQYLAVDSTATAYTSESNHVPYMLYDQANKTLECRGFGSTGSIEPVDPYSLALEYKLEYDMDDTGLVKQIDANREAAVSLKEDLGDIAKYITSKNLLNPNRVTLGKRMYVDGSVHELDSDFYTDFIAVKPNQHIYASFLNPTGNFVRSQIRHVCAYNASKTVLPSKGQSDAGYDYLVQDGVAYIVVTFTQNDYMEYRQLEVSDSGITSFEKWFAPHLELIEKSQVEQNRRDILETKIKVNENSSRLSFLDDNNDNIMPISNTPKGMARKYNKGVFHSWEKPEEYDFKIPFDIFTDGNSFKTNFNAETYKNNYSNVKYIAPDGNDSNDGTIENPWKSFGKIREINGVTCYLEDGIYTVENFSNWDGRLIGNFNLIGLGDVKIVNGDCPDNWELEDGLYKTVCKSDYRACIDIETDVAGIKYTKTDSLLDCKATKCSYFKTSEFIYINTSLDTPNKKIALIYNNMEKCFLIYAYSYDTTPYIKNIKWYGSPNSETENSPSVEFVSYNDQVGKSKAVFDNCGFYCGYVGVQTNQAAETIFYNCEAANVYTDGFQYFGESKNIEINCKGYGCGLDHIQDNGQYDNGSTAHGKCNTVRINGSYYGNNGGNCADALDSNAFSLCLGCSAFDSAAEITSQGFALQGGQLSRMYLEACTAFGNKYDIQSGANGTIKIKKCESETTSENGGVIETIN